MGCENKMATWTGEREKVGVVYLETDGYWLQNVNFS